MYALRGEFSSGKRWNPVSSNGMLPAVHHAPGMQRIEIARKRLSVHGTQVALLFRLGNPSGGRIDLLPQDQIQLCAVVLNVTHAIKEELGNAEARSRGARGIEGALLIERFDRRAAFAAAVVEVAPELLFRIGPVG